VLIFAPYTGNFCRRKIHSFESANKILEKTIVKNFNKMGLIQASQIELICPDFIISLRVVVCTCTAVGNTIDFNSCIG